jgi:hypothetical protein
MLNLKKKRINKIKEEEKEWIQFLLSDLNENEFIGF